MYGRPEKKVLNKEKANQIDIKRIDLDIFLRYLNSKSIKRINADSFKSNNPCGIINLLPYPTYPTLLKNVAFVNSEKAFCDMK